MCFESKSISIFSRLSNKKRQHCQPCVFGKTSIKSIIWSSHVKTGKYSMKRRNDGMRRNLNTFVCVCACFSLCVYVCVCVFVCVCVCMYVCVSVHLFICLLVNVCVCVCVCVKSMYCKVSMSVCLSPVFNSCQTNALSYFIVCW